VNWRKPAILAVAAGAVLGSQLLPASWAEASTPSQEVATGTDYASAYWDCAEHGWSESVVNSCRWAAAVYFGGQHDLYYYRTHTTESA
jgi:hypothetical protein